MADTIENLQEQNTSLWNNNDPNAIGVRVPYTADTYRPNLFREVETAQQQPFHNSTIFRESFTNMFQDTTLGAVKRIWDVETSKIDEEGNPLLTKEEANAKFAEYGVTFNKDVYLKEAEVIAAQKMRETAARQRMANSENSFMSGTSTFMGAIAGGVLDPINLIGGFVSTAKYIPMLRRLEQAGMAGRIAAKGVDGVIMNSLVEPLPLIAAGVDQRDYTMADSLMNISLGGLITGGIGGVVEGVRALSKGELFNANMKAASDFSNNMGFDTIKEIQQRRATITSFAYDDLVSLNADRVNVQKLGDNYIVKLKEDGPLSKLTGVGKDTQSAIQNLRQQIGALIEDDSIFKGYRLDDGIDNFYRALNEAGSFGNMKAFAKYLDNMQHKAAKKGLSFEDYLASRTKNFTDFSEIIKYADKSKKMQMMFEELSGDAFDEALEKAADAMDAMILIKEALGRNPRRTIAYADYRQQLNKLNYDRLDALERNAEYETHILEQQRQLEDLRNQLVTRDLTTDNINLTKQISDLETSIKASEREYNDFLKGKDIESWKADANNVKLLDAMRERLTTDPRDFADVKDTLIKQEINEDGKAWDTSDSILDEMTFTDEPIADEARMSKLEEDTIRLEDDLKLLAKTMDADDLALCKVDAEGRTAEMLKADNEIENMRDLQKQAEAYAECRRGEIV